MTGSALVVDQHKPRIDRVQSLAPVGVAVGVLIKTDGSFLLTTRPLGKAYSGYWEFPGGKIEPGETVQDALRRELNEELGITIESAQPWKEAVVDYPHALVRLSFCKVFRWSGDLQMREGQTFSWQALPVQLAPILPGTLPVLQWLAQERGSQGQPPGEPLFQEPLRGT